MACTSTSESDVPTFGVKCTTAEEDEAEDEPCGASAEPGIVKRLVSVGETGRAVRLACFFKILRVASVVANWN